MYKLIFFDTETTGNTEKDFLVQIAYKSKDESFTGLYKPEIKIPPEASAVHHITNKMVADKPTFKISTDQAIIKKLFEEKQEKLIAKERERAREIEMVKRLEEQHQQEIKREKAELDELRKAESDELKQEKEFWINNGGKL
jgi:hypothetical protein